jgi:hypothetical protein
MEFGGQFSKRVIFNRIIYRAVDTNVTNAPLNKIRIFIAVFVYQFGTFLTFKKPLPYKDTLFAAVTYFSSHG